MSEDVLPDEPSPLAESLADVTPLVEPPLGQSLAKIGDIAAAAGIRRIDMVAWRDLDHPEAGGSELHAASVVERWAAAGVEIRLTASRAAGGPRVGFRDGYRIERPAGRYGIFPAVSAQRSFARYIAPHLPDRGNRPPAPSEHRGSTGPSAAPPGPDATVEIWNGMPFFSPLWAPKPRLVFLHHVHDRMWDLVLPKGLAALGRVLESHIAPPVYRHTPVVTLSDSSRQAIIDLLRFDPKMVHVVRPGVEESFFPGPNRNPTPLVVAVGRLVPYKRFDRLIDVLVRLRERHPELRAVIAGEGQERPALADLIRRHGAEGWISLPGRIDDETLLDLYQRAWVLASTSAYEGWGLTITEAAACGAPAVVSPIAGHSDAVDDGVTGFLAEPGAEMEQRISDLLSNPLLRRRMERAARHRAAALTWDRTALEMMRLLAAQA